jgi:glutamate-1-semialdehyde 2,1-aminomutase
MATTEQRRERFRSNASESKRLHQRAVEVMPGGNSRTTVHFDPYPPYAAQGHGCVIIDADGEERLDFLNNYTSLIHGHADPDVNGAVIAQLESGTAFAMPTGSEIALAELLVERIPSVERVRFTNSGTEAVMTAIQGARGYTGRPKIAKFEGSYHGGYDFAAVSTSSPEERWSDDDPIPYPYHRGTPRAVLDQVLVLRYNDVAMAERVVEAHKDELAAVLVDPMPWRMGLIPGQKAFLGRLREMCDAHGIVLIFDEVITLRAGYGGVQEIVGVTPDLTTMAKIIGGGFPVGAVGGSEQVMSVFDPRGGKPAVPHGGTFNANPITMVAGYAAMRKMSREEFARLGALGAYVREGLAETLDGARVPGQVTGEGSLFAVHLHDRELEDFRSFWGTQADRARQKTLHDTLYAHGAIVAPALTGCLSTPMNEADANQLIDAFAASLREMSA